MFKRSIRRVLLAAMACPVLGASGAYDGKYTLVSVDDQRLPYNLILVDAKNRLILTHGEWILSGDRLTTRMWTTSMVNGASTKERRYNPEQHTARLVFSGNAAAGRLDTGTPVSTTFENGAMLTTYNGHRMRFEKH